MNTFRKPVLFFCTFLTSILFLGIVAMAAPTEVKDYNLLLNGDEIVFDAKTPALISDSRTLVPLRAFFNAINKDGTGTIDWDSDAKKVTLTYGGTSIELWIGNSTANVNGTATPIDGTYAIIYKDTTYVPLRFLATAFDMAVYWDGASKTTFAMDNKTLDQIAALFESSDLSETDYDGKIYMEYFVNMSGTVSIGDEPIYMETTVEMEIEYDKPNRFYHYLTKMSSMDGETITNEIYDDGQAMYVIAEDEVVKIEYSYEDTQDLLSQLNITRNLDLERQLLASLKLDEKDGNYVISGNVYMPETYFSDLLKNVEGMDDIVALASSMKLYISKPMHYDIVISKDTGMLVSMVASFSMNLEMDVEGNIVSLDMDYDVLIPKCVTDASFETTVPEEILNKAVEM